MPEFTFSHEGKSFTLETLSAGDSIGRKWTTEGHFFELDLLEHLQRLNRPGVYVDAGANFGNHTVYFSHFIPGCKSTLSIEAHPAIFEVLQRNLAANAFKPYEAVNLAVSDESGTVHMTAPDRQNSGATHISGRRPGENPNIGSPVNCTTLDLLLSGVEVAVIKLDVEGYEQQVIEGAEAIISEKRPVVTSELRKHEFDAFKSVMKRHNYIKTGRYGFIDTFVWEPQ